MLDLQKLAANFAAEVMALIQNASLDELVGTGAAAFYASPLKKTAKAIKQSSKAKKTVAGKALKVVKKPIAKKLLLVKKAPKRSHKKGGSK